MTGPDRSIDADRHIIHVITEILECPAPVFIQPAGHFSNDRADMICRVINAV